MDEIDSIGSSRIESGGSGGGECWTIEQFLGRGWWVFAEASKTW